ncbi:hypothetical protein TcWFU_008098 [Taenia crassiceps]|uniref:Uncharacterized protein n=1 Tax=Taenia crassiceps TaxID=6207 RepID=A0ABR4PZR5_9CEST
MQLHRTVIAATFACNRRSACTRQAQTIAPHLILVPRFDGTGKHHAKKPATHSNLHMCCSCNKELHILVYVFFCPPVFILHSVIRQGLPLARFVCSSYAVSLPSSFTSVSSSPTVSHSRGVVGMRLKQTDSTIIRSNQRLQILSFRIATPRPTPPFINVIQVNGRKHALPAFSSYPSSSSPRFPPHNSPSASILFASRLLLLPPLSASLTLHQNTIPKCQYS